MLVSPQATTKALLFGEDPPDASPVESERPPSGLLPEELLPDALDVIGGLAGVGLANGSDSQRQRCSTPRLLHSPHGCCLSHFCLELVLVDPYNPN